MRLDPTMMFVAVLLIGAVVGFLLDRFAGRGLLRRITGGGGGGFITSALVGIAGSFIGYHIGLLTKFTGTAVLVAAAIGALVVVWAWRMMR